MSTNYTAGPWFFDNAGNIWRRPPADLYENGGGVAGDKPLATVNKGWYRENEQGYPVEANARLIAAAPELLEALVEMADAMQSASEGGGVDFHAYAKLARAAIAKATGEQP